jgi:hypothetical protein
VVSTSDSNGDAYVLFPFEEIARDPDPERRQQHFLECKRAVTSITENAQLKLKKLEHKVDYLTSVCPRTRPRTQCATPTTTRERERKASSSREIRDSQQAVISPDSSFTTMQSRRRQGCSVASKRPPSGKGKEETRQGHSALGQT